MEIIIILYQFSKIKNFYLTPRIYLGICLILSNDFIKNAEFIIDIDANDFYDYLLLVFLIAQNWKKLLLTFWSTYFLYLARHGNVNCCVKSIVSRGTVPVRLSLSRWMTRGQAAPQVLLYSNRMLIAQTRQTRLVNVRLQYRIKIILVHIDVLK